MIPLLKKFGSSVHRLTGLLVSMALLWSMLPGALTEADAAGEQPTTDEVTQTRLENGSFENPQVDSSLDLANTWCVQTKAHFENRTNNSFYWNTTAFGDSAVGEGKFELGYPGKYDNYHVTGAADGTQFAELCAQDQSSLYQNVQTDSGAVYHWSLSHAARNSDMNNGTESMALFIGAKQDAPLYKKAKGIGANNDIFMWMAKLLKATGKINIDGSGLPAEKGEAVKTPMSFTIYSKQNINVQTDNITEENYKYFFSLTPVSDKGITKEWKCWIMTTKKGYGWQSYKGTYEIPEGQTETTFAFTALTGKQNGENFINEGNLLDNIVFEKQYPLRVTTTGGGKGRVYSVFDPNDPESESNKLVIDGELVTAEDSEMGWSTHDHFRRYDDGTELWVRATPKDGYTFSGAYIDGAFHRADEEAYFTQKRIWTGKVYETTYYQKIIMNKARFIQLVYTKANTVIFDPNGGMYNGTKANTEISSNSKKMPYTSTAATYDSEGDTPSEKKVQFIGWYTASLPSYYKDGKASSEKGAMVNGVVKIKYDNTWSDLYADFVSTYNYTYGDKVTTHTERTSASAGMTFIAQWEYLQTVKAMTMERTATEYVNSMKGGTVEITRMKGAESKITGRTITTVDDNGSAITGGGTVSKGYARMKDNIVLTAKPAEGYVFRGWYDEDTGEPLSANSTVYSYELGKGARTFQARFRAVLQFPYLSFVSKEANPSTTEAPFVGGTSLKVGDNKVDGYTAEGDGGTGQKKYGNTISTGFSTVQTFSSIAYDHCLWTIKIPKSSESPLYIKSKTPLPAEMNATMILPYDNADYNPGAIYRVNSFSGQEIPLKANLPTITGEGQAVFTVIIDNIYAPGATATLDLKTDETDPTEPENTIELGDQNSYAYDINNGTYKYYDDFVGRPTSAD